ncbi:sigma-70 family RNA polymerase sigma factor [Rummeliibacillus pycnus]|uniref:sigma-70 family RNA polymerase sigma factor n=1 Tax=Rummeliibacillus pycnus TaxID=101070 RepID=UPI003D27FDCA
MEKYLRDQLLRNAMDMYGDYLLRLAYIYVKDREIAEDLVQEAFINYYLHIDEFKGKSSLKTYLYRITVNKCHDYLNNWKYKKIYFTNLFSKFLVSTKTPEAEILINEQLTVLNTAIQKLPQKYKEIIVLYYFTELSIPEISEVLQCPTNTIKTRLARGRKKIRLFIEDMEGEYET